MKLPQVFATAGARGMFQAVAFCMVSSKFQPLPPVKKITHLEGLSWGPNLVQRNAYFNISHQRFRHFWKSSSPPSISKRSFLHPYCWALRCPILIWHLRAKNLQPNLTSISAGRCIPEVIIPTCAPPYALAILIGHDFHSLPVTRDSRILFHGLFSGICDSC